MAKGYFEFCFIGNHMWAFRLTDGSLDDWKPLQHGLTSMGSLPARLTGQSSADLGEIFAATIDAVNEAYPGTNLRPPPNARFKHTDPTFETHFAMEVEWDQVPFDQG